MAGPIAFLFNVGASFSVLPWTTETGELRSIYVTLAASMVLVAIAGWMSYQVWRDMGAPQQHQFAGFMGVLVSAFFVLGVIAIWLPVLLSQFGR